MVASGLAFKPHGCLRGGVEGEEVSIYHYVCEGRHAYHINVLL